MTERQPSLSLKHAVGYVRVSTAEQAEEGFSIAAQEARIRQECERYDGQMKLVHVYADEGISGKSIEKRPGMIRLLDDVKAGGIDAVICWNISRIARNVANLLEIIDILEKNSVSFISITEKMDTQTPAGRLMLQIMASMGEYERNNIAENVYLGSRRRAQEGWTNGGRVLGYDNVVDADGNRTLTVNKSEAIIVRRIFRDASLGKGYRSIANALNKEGYKTKRGNDFSSTAVKGIVSNPLYVGKVRYGEYRHWEKLRRKGKQEDVLLVNGKHPAIIDKNMWNDVARLVRHRKKVPTWNASGENVLTGLLRCPECGGPMAASNTTNRLVDGTKRRIRYYSCANFRNKGSAVCHANSIRADEAEELVKMKLIQTLSLKDIGESVLRQMRENSQERLSRIERQQTANLNNQDDLRHSLDKYHQLIRANKELETAILPRIEEIQDQLNDKQEEELNLEKTKKSFVNLPNPRDIQELLVVVARLIRRADKCSLKALYQTFIAQITFSREKKLVWVQLEFDNEIVSQLKAQSKEAESKADSVFSFTKRIEFVV
ncbi:recombinase family protein [Furfurilactobacillus curtus]|uniref:Recombinase RecB n=1 Tax=Furfurilactobacillus curtus TaxID=1746200 RepID=A0ABQ5JPW9_9LACO